MCARGAARRQKLTGQTAQYGDTRPRTAQPAGGAPVAAAAVILYPFTPVTDPGTAAMLLLQHVSYHIQLGVAKVVQYTQARPCHHRGHPHLGSMQGGDKWVRCSHAAARVSRLCSAVPPFSGRPPGS